MTLVGVLAWVLRVVLSRENEKRRASAALSEEGGEDVELVGGGKKGESTFYFMT